MRVLGLAAGQSPARWWAVLLTLGPLLGSFITEPAAMTICALLLGREFYRLGPSPRFMYATLGLPLREHFRGRRADRFCRATRAARWPINGTGTRPSCSRISACAPVAGIVISNVAYFLIFRKEFAQLAAERSQLPPDESAREEPVPFWITGVHLLFLGWTILVAHEPALFLGGFLFFLGFTLATTAFQDVLDMRSPMLVGFFLAGLVVHGGLQGWWIEPVLSRLGQYPLLLSATVLTAFKR